MTRHALLGFVPWGWMAFETNCSAIQSYLLLSPQDTASFCLTALPWESTLVTARRLARAAALVTLGGKLGNAASPLLRATFFGETYRTLAGFAASLGKFG